MLEGVGNDIPREMTARSDLLRKFRATELGLQLVSARLRLGLRKGAKAAFFGLQGIFNPIPTNLAIRWLQFLVDIPLVVIGIMHTGWCFSRLEPLDLVF